MIDLKNVEWKNYVIAGLIGLAALFYFGKQSKPDVHDAKKQVYFTNEARDLLRENLQEVDLSGRQLSAVLQRVDANDDCVIDCS